MSSLKKPVDKKSAQEAMKKFLSLPYQLQYRGIFEKAIQILYGNEFQVITDLSARMGFYCQVCNRDMNSEKAVSDHFRSGAHLKNVDKKSRETSNVAIPSIFPAGSLQDLLSNSKVKAIGLQMVEEYKKNSGGLSYYKCNLCGAHGKVDSIYHHIIGKKHTEKYIRSSFVLTNSVLTSGEREKLQQDLHKAEGGVYHSKIRVIIDTKYFPQKWMAEGWSVPKGKGSDTNFSKLGMSDLKISLPKKESSRLLPKRESCSPPDYKSNIKVKVKKDKARKPKKSKSSRCDTPTDTKGREELRRSKSPRERGKEISQKNRRRSRSSSLSPSSRSQTLSAFRNCSPPPLENQETRVQGPSHLPRTSTEIIQLPRTPPMNCRDAETQNMCLDELLTYFAFLIDTHIMSDTEVKTLNDLSLVVDLMYRITEALHSVPTIALEDGTPRPAHQVQALLEQQHVLGKIFYIIKFRMGPQCAQMKQAGNEVQWI